MRTLEPMVDCWHLASVAATRGASAAELYETWSDAQVRCDHLRFDHSCLAGSQRAGKAR
jgi:hypothetical protein